MSCLTKEMFESHKEGIVAWIKEKLQEATGEQDEMLVDYITIMLSNGKTAADIGTDLEALVDAEISSNITTGLNDYLTQITASEHATDVNATVLSEQSAVGASKAVSLKSKFGGSSPAALSGALSSGRDRTGATGGGIRDDNSGKKRSLADCGPLGGALSSSRGGSNSNRDHSSRDSRVGKRDSNNYNNNRDGNHSQGQNFRDQNQLQGSKIQPDGAGGFITNKRGRNDNSSSNNISQSQNQSQSRGQFQGQNRGHQQQQQGSESEVDKLAQMSGFKSAQEMIVFQQQQLMTLMQQQQQQQQAQVQQQSAFGGYFHAGGHQQLGYQGRGMAYRGGRGGRGFSPRGRGAPPPPPTGDTPAAAANADLEVVKIKSGDDGGDILAPDGVTAGAAGTAGGGEATYGGRGYGGRGYAGRGGRGFNPHAAPYEPGAYAGRGRGGRGFDPSIAGVSAPFAGAGAEAGAPSGGRGYLGRGGRGFYGSGRGAGFTAGGRAQGNIFGFTNSQQTGSDNNTSNTEATLNGALSTPPVGVYPSFPSAANAFPSKHKTWVREDLATTSATATATSSSSTGTSAGSDTGAARM